MEKESLPLMMTPLPNRFAVAASLWHLSHLFTNMFDTALKLASLLQVISLFVQLIALKQ